MKKLNLLFLLIACLAINTVTTAQKIQVAKNFGNNGLFETDLGWDDGYIAHEMIQPDGKPLFSITISDEFGYLTHQQLYRLTTAGKLDKTFGGTGSIPIGNGDGGGVIRGGYFDLQDDGKIIAANLNVDRDGVDPDRVVIERFLANGSRDSSFGTNGVVVFMGKAPASLRLNSIKARHDGKILISGNLHYPFTNKYFQTITQLKSNGGLDLSFGDGGTVRKQVTDYGERATNMIVLPGNEFITADTHYDTGTGSYSSCLVAYNTNGTVDSSKGTNGVVFNKSSAVDYDIVIGLALQADNKILAFTASGDKGLLLRYKTNLTPDNSFGKNGKVTLPENNNPHVVQVQSNQRIVVNMHKRLKRFLSDGTPDSSFGKKSILNISTDYFTMLFALNAERLYVAGTEFKPDADFVLAAVNAYNFCNNCASGITANDEPAYAETNSAGLQLFPNPVINNITINGLNTHSINQLQLTDVTGRVLKTASTQNATYQWSLQNLPVGIYYIKISNKQGTVKSFKIIKQ